MHRMHHAHSDTAQDPHSPKYLKNPVRMMKQTLDIYLAIHSHRLKPETRFEGDYPVWPSFDRWADVIPVRLLWVGVYLMFYIFFANAWWHYLFVPLHIFMGPVHGAIVNWCGHRYGYVNHQNHDESRNTFFADILTMGELMQNNHHRDTARPNFANRWFEWDPTYPFLKFMSLIKVIQFVPVRSSK